MGINNWTDKQLDCVVTETVNTLRLDGTTTLAQALFDAQNLYIAKLERLSLGSYKTYAAHSLRLVTALEAAGVEYPDREKHIKGGLKHHPIFDMFPRPKENLGSKVPSTTTTVPPDLIGIVNPSPVLYTLDQALDQLKPFIEKLVLTEVRRLLGEPPDVNVTSSTSTPNLVGSSAETVKPKLNEQPNKIHCLVLGLLDSQAQDVLKRSADSNVLRGRVSFKFWKDESPTKLNLGLKWANAVFFMTRFSGHAALDRAQSHKAKVIYCNGGTTSLMYNITELVESVMSAKANALATCESIHVS